MCPSTPSTSRAIEALVAVVNHRHGTPDWMPIQLKLRDDLEEAMAAYKHYDVLLVNAMFDGMNLVAKEGPIVNERDGVSILSENTGAHEELGEFALSVNPFDIQETADSIYAALTMYGAERQRRARGLVEIVTSRDPGDWIDEQLADIAPRARGPTPESQPCRAVAEAGSEAERVRDRALSSPAHPRALSRGADALIFRRRSMTLARPHIRPRADARPPGRGAHAREDRRGRPHGN